MAAEVTNSTGERADRTNAPRNETRKWQLNTAQKLRSVSASKYHKQI